jgi:uncharacterized protein (DUF305 family)
VFCALVLAAAGCGAGATAGPAPAASSAPATSAAVGTDAAWLQLTIPMNEQALPLLDLAAERGTDPALRVNAARIVASHRAELVDLRYLRDRAGLPATNVHEGHDLPGMVLPEDLTAIDGRHGTDFDRAVAEALREHLEQGARLADAEHANGVDADTRQLAARIAAARRYDLGRLHA